MPYIHDDAGASVTLAHKIAGENIAEDVQRIREECSGALITAATTTVVKSAKGRLRSITILGGTMGAIDVYDNTAASGTKLIPTFTPPAAYCGTLTFYIPFVVGLTIVTAAATLVQVSYD